MKHLLLTTIAAVLVVGCGGPSVPAISILDAALSGNIEAVKQHLAAGTDVNAKASNGTPLLGAAYGGHKELVALLIDKGADVNAKDRRGWTPLHQTAYGGHKDVAELLIANDVDVNAKDDEGKTPLHLAAFEGHKEIVELLIAKGADVNGKDDGGMTPLAVAIHFKHPETADLLRKHGGKTGAELENAEPVAEATQPEPPTAKAPDISIHDAARDGNIEAVKQHITAGTDVNAKSEWGMSPLHYAVVNGRKEIAELLIAAGADVNLISDFRFGGETPLDKAIKYKQTEISALLRKHGGKTGEELKAEGK